MPKRIMIVAALGVVAAVALYGVAMATHGVVVGQMTGAQVINDDGAANSGDPDGTGAVKLTLRPDTDQICFRVAWANIDQPLAATLYKGAAGTNAPLTLTLFSSSDAIATNINAVNGCVSAVSDDMSADLRANPSTNYVQVRTPEYERGAIRAQLKHPPKRR